MPATYGVCENKRAYVVHHLLTLVYTIYNFILYYAIHCILSSDIMVPLPSLCYFIYPLVIDYII